MNKKSLKRINLIIYAIKKVFFIILGSSMNDVNMESMDNIKS